MDKFLPSGKNIHLTHFVLFYSHSCLILDNFNCFHSFLISSIAITFTLYFFSKHLRPQSGFIISVNWTIFYIINFKSLYLIANLSPLNIFFHPFQCLNLDCWTKVLRHVNSLEKMINWIYSKLSFHWKQVEGWKCINCKSWSQFIKILLFSLIRELYNRGGIWMKYWRIGTT